MIKHPKGNNPKEGEDQHKTSELQHPTHSLKITPATENPLTRDQKAFNELIAQVALLNNQIQHDNQRLERLLQAYTQHLPGLVKKFAEGQLRIAKALDQAAESVRLGARHLESVREVILWFCRSAFQQTQPDEEAKALFGKWAGTSYQQALEQQGENLLQKLADDLLHRYGIYLDISDLEATPGGFAELKARIRQHQEQQQEQEDAEAAGRAKSGKRQAREQKRKARTTEQLRSIRSIYLALAKMLHPDTATSEAERLHKEELMKRVAVAYREKDLAALLHLELEFVATESTRLNTLPGTQLKLYIAALREQVTTLKQQLHQVHHQPRFADIAQLATHPEQTALNHIKAHEKKLKLQVKETERATAFLRERPERNELLEFVLSVEADIGF